MGPAVLVAAQLAITVYPHGLPGPPVAHYTVHCQPAAGTVPSPARACGVLSRLAHPFAPVPPDMACAQIAMGPQVAVVSGRLRGSKVWARLRLSDSCQIARWRRLRAVVPGFAGR